METNEFQKYINKRVELKFKDDNKLYKGKIDALKYVMLIGEDEEKYILIEDKTMHRYNFSLRHLEFIKELE